MSDEPTPRTDAAVYVIRDYGAGPGLTTSVDWPMVKAEFARGLERENARLIVLLTRFWTEGTSLGASHPHLSSYVTFPVSVWEETRAIIAPPTTTPQQPASPG